MLAIRENRTEGGIADGYHGDRHWPLWLLVFPVSLALTLLLMFIIDALPAGDARSGLFFLFWVVWIAAVSSGIAFVFWFVLWAVWRVTHTVTPMAQAVRAQVRGAMVNLGFLAPDATRWGFRLFKVDCYRGSGRVVVLMDCPTLRPASELPGALMESRATEAQDIDGELVELPDGRTAYRLVLSYPGTVE